MGVNRYRETAGALHTLVYTVFWESSRRAIRTKAKRKEQPQADPCKIETLRKWRWSTEIASTNGKGKGELRVKKTGGKG